MKFGAIDIGSNAVRLLVEEVRRKSSGRLHVEKVSFTRVPLRLGDDVFETGTIGPEKASALVKTMKAFWYLMDVHGVENYRACATSAMRESENREELKAWVKGKANIDIDIIDGKQEADLIFGAFTAVSGMGQTDDFLYIDVGGGSTEITLIRNGERLRAQSFKLGTVRSLKGRIPDGEWDAVEAFVTQVTRDGDSLLSIGTGGNINRYHRLIGGPRFEPISRDRLEEVFQEVQALTYLERMEQLGMKPDRADVIVPAGEIYLRIMKLAGSERIMVPKVGLSDGMILSQFAEWESLDLRLKA
jgi:exopolyphosphatase/guanosine-5'-triphosphate,3'-diphosphate pyrophosphatase